MNPAAAADAKPALEITVTMTDGRTVKFAQTDIDMAKALIERIQPSRQFSPSLLMIGGDAAMRAFPTQSIVRLDIISDLLPSYPLPLSVSRVVEISEDVFTQGKTWVDAVRPPVTGGDEIVVYQVMHLTSKEVLYLEIHIDRPANGIPSSAIRTTLDRPGFASLIFQSHGLHALKQGGGLIIVNPIHITQLTFLPGPPVIPAGVWHADRLE